MPANPTPNILSRQNKPITQPKVIVVTANKTLRAADDGSVVIFDTTTSVTVTLPPARKGMSFRFFVKQIGASTGHVVAVTGATPVMLGKVSPTGAAAAATAGKGRINTNATATVGDGLFVVSHNGTDWSSDPTGTWATQP